jgi:hypothetical protein
MCHCRSWQHATRTDRFSEAAIGALGTVQGGGGRDGLARSLKDTQQEARASVEMALRAASRTRGNRHGRAAAAAARLKGARATHNAVLVARVDGGLVVWRQV